MGLLSCFDIVLLVFYCALQIHYCISDEYMILMSTTLPVISHVWHHSGKCLARIVHCGATEKLSDAEVISVARIFSAVGVHFFLKKVGAYLRPTETSGRENSVTLLNKAGLTSQRSQFFNVKIHSINDLGAWPLPPSGYAPAQHSHGTRRPASSGPVWGRAPLFPLVHLLPHLFPFLLFFFLSLALPIFFFCPSLPFLPE